MLLALPSGQFGIRPPPREVVITELLPLKIFPIILLLHPLAAEEAADAILLLVLVQFQHGFGQGMHEVGLPHYGMMVGNMEFTNTEQTSGSVVEEHTTKG